MVLLGGRPLRRPQRRPDVDGDPLEGGGAQRDPRQPLEQAIALADGHPGGELGHPQADLQARLALIQPQLMIQGGKALVAAGTVIAAASERVAAPDNGGVELSKTCVRVRTCHF